MLSKSNLAQILRSYGHFGFSLSRKIWDRLELATLVNRKDTGRAANEVYLLRGVADRFNEQSARATSPHGPIHAGQLASVSVLVDILRYIVELYCHEEQPGSMPRALEWVAGRNSKATVTQPPPSFIRLFPPATVLEGASTQTEFIENSAKTPSVRDTIVREMVLLYLSASNPAFRPFKPLFDDADLKAEVPYVPLVQGLEAFFATQPPFGPVGLTLFECLLAPIKAAPHSLEEQLNFVRRNWAHFLPLDLLERLLLALDILEEERLMRGLGPGPLEALRFDRDAYGIDLGYDEPAAFSRDADWMSNVVLIAKTVYVWLYQLSRKHGRDIRLLSDIPDEELDQLARWGFSGLWLIGVWERSSASRKIKQIMGNPEAASSAYSLYDYVIASDLGGEEAFQQLRHRAWQRGIRLASDMVPNHMGIYSKWVIEHPQWFLQSEYPPFPVYQYTGIDLSEDSRVCLQIEDGYWQHRDAAVVFKRIDKWTGDTRYIYHGNDGTSMPWNDTAQLNFLIPEVREAVIQTILHVARKFPVIRFDAAMTLAKKHYQRLWFPQPGEGGAIPSRAEHSMTKGQFDSVFPKEFWREVVDRIHAEVPDTLLLAEAFWLMEGYFVRTLGMHRVYNSAFMNMLKMEDNAKYRTTVRNVLEFSPEVLKRFVNFMNNPDERTAVDQFGRSDKYYGVAMMMVTMPGLPMFGHGQIEGFTEKYGMEYRRSYWDEQVDWGMVHHHESQIFPLMRRRHLFSGAANFAFYDFITPEGWVDENVFAYSNRSGDERALILYNNAYTTTKGHVQLSTAINIGEGDQTNLVRRSLGEALALNTADDCYYVFRDHRTGLEYLRHGRQLADLGLFAELHAYQYHAFLDFREVHDKDGSWRELEQRLDGNGAPNVTEAHRELVLEPILTPYRRLMNPEAIRNLRGGGGPARDQMRKVVADFYTAVKQLVHSREDVAFLVKQFMSGWEKLMPPARKSKTSGKVVILEKVTQPSQLESWTGLDHLVYSWLTLRSLSKIRGEADSTPAPVMLTTRLDEWLLIKVIRQTFEELLTSPDIGYWDSQLVRILASHPDLMADENSVVLSEAFRRALIDPVVRDYLQVHKYDGILWLNKERLERMVEAYVALDKLTPSLVAGIDKTPSGGARPIADQVLRAAEQAGYQVEKMVLLLA